MTLPSWCLSDQNYTFKKFLLRIIVFTIYAVLHLTLTQPAHVEFTEFLKTEDLIMKSTIMCGCGYCFQVQQEARKKGLVWSRIAAPAPNNIAYDNGNLFFDVIHTKKSFGFISSEHTSIPLPFNGIKSGEYKITMRYENETSAFGKELFRRKEQTCPFNGTIFLTGTIGSDNDTDVQCAQRTCYQKLSNNSTTDMCDKKRVILIGDSHLRAVSEAMHGAWDFRFDGDGIYYNTAAAEKAYINGRIGTSYITGKMLRGLSSHLYDKLQIQKNYSTWVLESGSWDFRDITIDEYKLQVNELFEAFLLFREKHHVTLVWSGVPAYSFKFDKYRGMEKRTNVKLYVGNEYVHQKCIQHNIPFVDFFSITFPEHTQSCDTHHYLCHGSGKLGLQHLELLRTTTCSLDRLSREDYQ